MLERATYRAGVSQRDGSNRDDSPNQLPDREAHEGNAATGSKQSSATRLASP